MADLKSKHGFERAQFRGRPSVQIQALLTAAVINVKQLVKGRPEAQSGTAVPLDLSGWQALRAVVGRLLRAMSLAFAFARPNSPPIRSST